VRTATGDQVTLATRKHEIYIYQAYLRGAEWVISTKSEQGQDWDVTEKTWHEVMDKSAGVENEPVRVYVDKDEIALFNVGGEIFATGNICTHAMASMHDGIQEGEVIECPRHDGKFDVRTGAPLGPPVIEPLPTYEVKVENGKIFVKV